MNTEQREYISLINSSKKDEILIKRTCWEEINLIPHSHNKHQIIYTLSGTLHVEAQGCSYFVPERRIVWIPTDMEHKLSSNNSQVSLLILYVAFDSQASLANKDTLSIYNTNELVCENLKFISSHERLISRHTNPDLFWFIQSFLNLLPQISPEAQSLFKTLVVPNDSRLHPVIDYISMHIKDELRLGDLASLFHFSPRNLSRLFRQSGIHFSSYLNTLRIMRSIELLTDGKMNIQEIAYATGFSSPNNFNRVFKQIVGLPPKLYISK